MLRIAAALSLTLTLANPAAALSDAEKCDLWEALAENAMLLRQQGVPLSDALAVSADQRAAGNVMGEIHANFVKQAFRQRKYSSHEMQWAQINEFSSQALLTCLDQTESLK